MKNALNWFELPTENFDRAVACYETLLATTLRRGVMPTGMPYAVFPHDPPGAGGALAGDPSRPRGGGPLIYLNADGQLDAILARVPAAGAKVVMPKTAIGKDGFIAILEDTEGNRIGLNSEG